LNTISAQLTEDGPASARDLDRAGKARCCVMSGTAAAVAVPMSMAVTTAAGEAVGRCRHQKGQGQQAQRDGTHRGLLSRDRSTMIGLAYLGLTNGREPALIAESVTKAAARSRLRAGHNLHTERLRGLPFCNCATPQGAKASRGRLRVGLPQLPTRSHLRRELRLGWGTISQDLPG
jgi:hypothetical protein